MSLSSSTVSAFDHQGVQIVRRTDVSQPPIDDPRVTSYRFILFGQSLAVIASIAGFIGLTIAYKALIRGRSGIVEPPTIE
jgi:hypothetical protein